MVVSPSAVFSASAPGSSLRSFATRGSLGLVDPRIKLREVMVRIKSAYASRSPVPDRRGSKEHRGLQAESARSNRDGVIWLVSQGRCGQDAIPLAEGKCRDPKTLLH
jgi:hypothetical protein